MLRMKVGGKFFHSYAVWYAQGELFTNKSVYQSNHSQLKPASHVMTTVFAPGPMSLRVKNNNLGFRVGPTQTRLHSHHGHRSRLEA